MCQKKLISLFLLFLSPFTKAELLVDVLDTTTWGGSTYYLLDKSTWDDAQSTAIALGGNLVTINNAEEHIFINETWGGFSGSEYAMTYLWIGLNDEDNEGEFTWISGEEVTYTLFTSGEPNGGENENQVYMWYRSAAYAGYWNDFDGSRGVDYYDGVYGVVEVVDDPTGLSSAANITDLPSPHVGIFFLSFLAYQARRRSPLNQQPHADDACDY
ncbi:C-type lectin domain-containing protein [Alteromonas sp. 14N.309.X.WAT.G.H12]|uniref:C-type lectin domain-containing protein n=1 Tax=Alteromonas sp. 14N.309.X.WAT.G.H12 TaxID=3120824 RepID=UPI002FD09B58